MKCIMYASKINNNSILQVGGTGHSFCDYITPLIISKLYPQIKFIHNKMETTLQKRDMDIDNDNNIYYWNDFLNLDYLDNMINTENCNLYNLSNNEQFKSIDINNLENTINNNNDNNLLYYISDNNRIYLFDLYNMELQGLVRKKITQEIILDLRKAYYLKHEIKKNHKKIINVYIRRGDLYQYFKNKNINNEYYDFEYNIFKYIYSLLPNKNDYIINVISAGNINEINDVKHQFSEFENINFILNADQGYVFKLLTQSDLLIFSSSSFPFTASLYSNGYIIKKKTDYYFSDCIKFKDIVFLDNYIFIDNMNELANNTFINLL